MATESAVKNISNTKVPVIGWLSWAHFLNDGIANYLPGILPYLLVERHVPAALAGTFMTALLLSQALQPISGWIADRVGGRTLVLGGVALSTLSAAAIGWAHPIWLILSLLILTGIGNTGFHPQALSITRREAGSKAGTIMAIFLVGGEIGRSLGPLAAGLVVHALGIQWIWLLGLPLAITYVSLLKVIPVAPRKNQGGRPLQMQRHLKPASALLAYSLVRSATTYEMVTLAPLLWHQQGGGLVTGALTVTVLIGVGIAGNLGGGRLNDHIGKRRVLLWTSLLAILSLAGFAILHGVWMWIVLGTLGIALFGASSTTMLIGQDIFSENPALGSGIALGLANGLGAILVIPLTYFAAHWGDAPIVWIMAALTAATIPMIWGMPVRTNA